MTLLAAQRIFLLAFVMVMCMTSMAQDRYFVHFCDKPETIGSIPDLIAFGFDAKAIERRMRHGIPFPMEDDFPVYQPYIDAVQGLVTELRYVLRWPNAVSVEASPEQIAKVQDLPFVTRVEPFEPMELVPASMHIEQIHAANGDVERERKMKRLYALQTSLTHLDTLRKAGLTGAGVRIAVFDAGFKEVEDHPAFRKLWERNGLIEAKDFYKGKKPFKHSRHGTAVLGCIVGWWDSLAIGSATGAEILLARTEFSPAEKLKEQDAWMAAAEWADQQGAGIISSSLGYSRPLHTYSEMDGRTTTVAKAASHAVRKGILVVNSAGNQGDEKFHFLSSPGDADSVLTVAASYPMIRFPMPFSSFGPNAAGVAKPDVAGPGYMLSAGRKGEIDFFSGTSFACPTIAGMAACMMQRHPNMTNMEIRQLMVESAHLYPYYDYVLGNGVVDAHQLLDLPRDSVSPTFELSYLEDTLIVAFDSVALGPDSLFSVNGKPFFFHVENAQGQLLEYRYLRITKGIRQVGIPPERRPKGILRIWFEGYLQEVPDRE
jgi:subtilisin family serine protease